MPARAAFDGRGWSSAAWVHLMLRAAKLAYADRDATLADPAASDVPVDELLSDRHVESLAARIDPASGGSAPTPVRTLVGGTIYLAVVDADGNRGELIQSNAAGFGSGVVDPETGVHFQDRGASFSLTPEPPAC
ncbi:MAG: gamma-glutamyltransferase [Chloroflexota bacterium]